MRSRFVAHLSFLLAFLLSASAEAQRKYFIDGVNGSDAVTAANNSALTPWKTLTKWKTDVFDVYSVPGTGMNTGDEVVVSGLVREPTGVVLNAISYPPAQRYMKGIRQWRYDLDGPVGTVGTQVEQYNSVRRARFTSATVLTGTFSGGGASPLVISATNLGSTIAADGAIGYITYAYYKNIDKYGRHYGLFKEAAAAPGANGTQEYFYDATAATTSTITLDATNIAGSPSITDFEYVRDSFGAIIVFQNWIGHGIDAEALLDGIAFDRVVLRSGGAYLASMENCDGAGFRNIVGWDGGHHSFGITGSGSRGCWLDNVVAYGQWGQGADSGTSGGEGGNSLTSSGVVLQTSDLTWTLSTLTLSGTLTQQTPLVGTVIELVSGTGVTAGQLVTVTEATSSTSFKVTPALTGVSNGTANIRVRYRNMCVDNLVRRFDYHAYAPLGLQVTSGVAAPLTAKTIYGLSNVVPASTLGGDAPCSNNRYRQGKVTWYFDSMRNAGTSSCLAVNAANAALGEASNLWDADTYPLLFEDVVFDGPQQITTAGLRDVAFRRCSITFAPSIFSDVYGAGGPQIYLQNKNGNNTSAADAFARVLFESSSVIGNMTGTGAGQGALIGAKISTSALQTGWTYTAGTKTLSGGTISNAPVPRAGMKIVIYGGTGFASNEEAIVESATASSVVLRSALVANAGITTAVTFELCMSELRAQNSLFLCVGGNAGAATPVVTTTHVCSMSSSGVPGLYRGARVWFYNCILGNDRTTNATTQRIFSSDTSQAAGGSRIVAGNIYLNHTEGRISDATNHDNNLEFLHRTTGADTTGWAEYSNVLLNGAISPWLIEGSHPYGRPTPAQGSSPFAGVNRRRFTGIPGPWQFGAPMDAVGDLRGRTR